MTPAPIALMVMTVDSHTIVFTGRVKVADDTGHALGQQGDAPDGGEDPLEPTEPRRASRKLAEGRFLGRVALGHHRPEPGGHQSPDSSPGNRCGP
jgi:hypothetical protein